MALNTTEIGKRIAKIRKAHHITQDELAEMLSVTPKHISHVERGKSNLALPQLAELCERLDCSMDYIVFGDSTDSVLSRLPDEIIDILNGYDADKMAILQRYLKIIVEKSDYE